MGLGHHHHGHSHGPCGHHHAEQSRAAEVRLGWAFAINLVFTLIEIVGGFLTNSVAVIGDALHDFGDCVALGLAWGLQRVSRRPRDQVYSYGYARLSTLASLLTGVMLVVGAAVVTWISIQRLLAPEPVHADGMIALALLGVAMNGFAAFSLRRGQGLNEQVAYWHLLEDAAGWVAVLLGAVAIRIWGITWLDAVLSLGISGLVVVNVVRRLKTSVRVFLQAVPAGVDLDLIRSQIEKLLGVRNVHFLQIWSVDGLSHVATLHLVVSAASTMADCARIKAETKSTLAQHRVEWVTIEIEAEGENCAVE